MVKSAMLFWLLLLCFCLNRQGSVTQPHITKTIVFKRATKDSFAFANNWDYPAGLIKDDGGKFHKRTDREITKKDTSHLYFTAHCRTNVQGGYAIRYCYAKRKAGGIGLSFLDGEPAYASEINVFILEGKFTFTSKIIYPELSTGSKVIYKVTASKLFLYNKHYNASKEISGYIDAEFTETMLLKGKIEKHQYYLKGYFKAPINLIISAPVHIDDVVLQTTFIMATLFISGKEFKFRGNYYIRASKPASLNEYQINHDLQRSITCRSWHQSILFPK